MEQQQKVTRIDKLILAAELPPKHRKREQNSGFINFLCGTHKKFVLHKVFKKKSGILIKKQILF